MSRLVSALRRVIPPPRLLRVRRFARLGGWLFYLFLGSAVLVAKASDGEGDFAVLVAVASFLLAGLYVMLEWGLATLLVGRMKIEGLGEIVRYAVTGEETIQEGKWVRRLGLVWLLLGAMFVVLVLGGLVVGLLEVIG